MREIKFRYWNGVSNMMVNDPVIPTMKKEEWTLEQYFSDRGWVWMQFTGLIDRNGVEIYEDDVVRSDLDQNCGGIVEWCVPNACYVIKEPDGTLVPIDIEDGTARMKETEVIGNIHQNPELLK